MLARLARPSSAIALAVVAGLGLSACGGGDDEGNPGAAAPGPATTPAGAPAGATGSRPKVAASTPEGVVTLYIKAFMAGDGTAVCKLYTPAQRRRIAKAFGGTCAGGIDKAFQQGGAEDGFKQSLGNLRVGSTKVTGKSAVVQLVVVRDGGSSDALQMKLTKSGKSWRIDRPSGG